MTEPFASVLNAGAFLMTRASNVSFGSHGCLGGNGPRSHAHKSARFTLVENESVAKRERATADRANPARTR